MATKLSPEQERLLNYLSSMRPRYMLESLFSQNTIKSLIKRELIWLHWEKGTYGLTTKGAKAQKGGE